MKHLYPAKPSDTLPRITFLGTGTSQGVPLIGCKCKVCQSTDPRDKRLRSSVAVDIEGQSWVIDTGPDFRQQMLRDQRDRLDAVLYTHGHKDHIAGLDDIRAFNFTQNKAMMLYLDEATEESIRREFAYIFANFKYPGIPQVDLHRVEPDTAFAIAGVEIIPLAVMHYKLPVLGYRMGKMAYITDANFISEQTLSLLEGLDILVLNALRREKHISHFTLEEALKMARRIDAKQTYFTHISHQLGTHGEVTLELPEGVDLAYDGLQVLFSI